MQPSRLHRRQRTCRPAVAPACLLLALAGCQTAPPGPDRGTVSAHLTQRVGHTLPVHTTPGEITLPPGASLDDGLTEDEAVAIALWNNAAFQELLLDLGVARGDLIQAGLLPNPEFLYFVGVPSKPFKYAFEFPIEALWLRPIRVKVAGREADRTAERLTQAGLDLMRDVRQAYADVALADERVRIAAEAVKLRGRIAELAGKRLNAGDISPQEGATAQIDSLQAEQDAVRIRHDVPVLEERLRNLMGLGRVRAPITLAPPPPPPCVRFDADALTHEATACRPDALAAAEAVAAAEARLRFARLGWVRLLGIGDASSGRATGHEFGPALRFTVPLFNRNQGGIARAEAELERALRNQKTVAYQIILDVQRSHAQYRQACAELEVLRAKVRPEVEAAIRRAQGAYQEGNVTIFIVLETTRQLLDSYLREAQLNADVRRFWAELERSIGKRLELPLPGPRSAPAMDASLVSKFERPEPADSPVARAEPRAPGAGAPQVPEPPTTPVETVASKFESPRVPERSAGRVEPGDVKVEPPQLPEPPAARAEENRAPPIALSSVKPAEERGEARPARAMLPPFPTAVRPPEVAPVAPPRRATLPPFPVNVSPPEVVPTTLETRVMLPPFPGSLKPPERVSPGLPVPSMSPRPEAVSVYPSRTPARAKP